MRTLGERLTELSDDLFERTTPIDAADCMTPPPATLQGPTNRKGRRAIVAAIAAAVVLSGTGFTYLLTRHEDNAVQIETTVPTTVLLPTTVHTTTVTAPADPIGALPDCIPVADSAGDTVGCALKSELYPPNPSPRTRTPPSGMPGFPVYDHLGGTIVGYEIVSVGYVPASMTNDPAALAQLTDCMSQLNHGTLDGSPALAGCIRPLQQYGIADPATEAHKRAMSLREAMQQSQSLTRQEFGPSPPTQPSHTH